ncbi:MAG: beta-lactamase family protein [Oscillospiraceae bacterium]|jgi:CubicO group peptidase (beta-lactamase class C family)|nr:beta-lactamase family protein [Oscillospiraceae bacterium]
MSTGHSGFDVARLSSRLDNLLRRFVDTDEAAGVAVKVVRHGETAYRGWNGFANIEERRPIQGDTLYRIFSMTKTFTSVTLMTLYEQGLIRLDDPVYEFIPEFKDIKVAETDYQNNVSLAPAKRPVTLRHLATMTSGMPYPNDSSPAGKAMAALQKTMADSASTMDYAKAAASAPLAFHPGERWMYGFSHDILGAVIETVSGKRFGEYMKEAVLDPLGLNDTAFYCPKEKRGRLAEGYWHEKGKKPVNAVPSRVPPAPDSPPALESGGGGLISSLDDVSRFAQMLVKGGKLDGAPRVLSRKTIQLIASNQLNAVQQGDFSWDSVRGYGYGLCVRTMLNPAETGLNGSVGEFAWDGMMGTWYCVDPQEDMTAVFMIQRLPAANQDHPRRVMQAVYGSLDD